MTTGAALGYGTKLKMGDAASPEVFAEIAQIKTLDDGDTAEQVETTNHQSTGSRREYIGGLIDGDEVTFTVNYLPTNATQSLAAGLRSKIRTVVNFRLEEPGNSTGMQFAALVVSASRSYPVDNVMEMQVTLKKTGAITTYAVS